MGDGRQQGEYPSSVPQQVARTEILRKSERNALSRGTSAISPRYQTIIRGRGARPMDYYTTMAACAGTGSFLIAALMALYG